MCFARSKTIVKPCFKSLKIRWQRIRILFPNLTSQKYTIHEFKLAPNAIFRYHHLAQKRSDHLQFQFHLSPPNGVRRSERPMDAANNFVVATVHRASELGDVAEWSNAPVSKTGMGQPIRGSNPLVSAKKTSYRAFFLPMAVGRPIGPYRYRATLRGVVLLC